MTIYTLTQQDDSLLTKTVSGTYQLQKYVKSKLTPENVRTLGLYRSVIVSKDTNKVLCFSPPKSISYEEFKGLYAPSEVVAEEFIEGTMINLFYDLVESKWVISTKSMIHGNCTFFMVPPYERDNLKTFSEMFIETCIANQFNYTELDKSLCYSFVLQHPDNRIVGEVKTPTIYLVALYYISSTAETGETIIESVDVSMPNLEFRSKFQGFFGSGVRVPQRYLFGSYEELEERHTSGKTPFNTPGFILKCPHNGERAKKWNPVYLHVKELRGNNPRLDYRYIQLRHNGKVREYLKYYPEFKKQFETYRKNIHEFTNQLYQNYVDCYILKKNKLSYFSSPYKNHMYKIHEIYNQQLRPQRLYVTRNHVIDYVNELPEALLLYALGRRNVSDIEQVSSEVSQSVSL